VSDVVANCDMKAIKAAVEKFITSQEIQQARFRDLNYHKMMK
jgi:hypothetical protein